MNTYFTDAGIKFPKFWDESATIDALTTLDTYSLYEFFGCSNATSFTRLMKPCFPNRPEKTSYSKYVRDLIEANKPAKPKWSPGQSRALDEPF